MAPEKATLHANTFHSHMNCPQKALFPHHAPRDATMHTHAEKKSKGKLYASLTTSVRTRTGEPRPEHVHGGPHVAARQRAVEAHGLRGAVVKGMLQAVGADSGAAQPH